MQSIRFTLPISASDTNEVWVRLRLRFVDILVKMWLLKAFFLVILPVPVMLKRFLALELVFIFGMFVIFTNYYFLFRISDVRFRIYFKSSNQHIFKFSNSPICTFAHLKSAHLLLSPLRCHRQKHPFSFQFWQLFYFTNIFKRLGKA